MKLQPKDFMIGDWVLVDGNPEQLTGVDREYIHLEGNCSTILLEGEVEPIPLTPEILEKNGFEIISEDVYKISNDLFVLTDDSPYSLCNSFDIGYGDEYNYITMIRYVHELQHALKLCGIEKEIVL